MSDKKIATKKILICALFAASAAIVGILEGILPLEFLLPIPGVRLGLANLFVMWTFYVYGAPFALGVSIARILTVFLFSGNVTALALSFIGGICAFIGQAICFPLYKKHCTMIGISVVSSVCHGLGQILAAYGLIGNSVLYYLPVLCGVSALTGIFTGSLMNMIASNQKLSDIFGKYK